MDFYTGDDAPNHNDQNFESEYNFVDSFYSSSHVDYSNFQYPPWAMNMNMMDEIPYVPFHPHFNSGYQGMHIQNPYPYRYAEVVNNLPGPSCEDLPRTSDPKPEQKLTTQVPALLNQFESGGLGRSSRDPTPKKCPSVCSQASCSSKCYSAGVCQDDNCSVGTPCNDETCLIAEEAEIPCHDESCFLDASEEMPNSLDEFDMLNSGLGYNAPLPQNGHYTGLEQDAALGLGFLRAPAAKPSRSPSLRNPMLSGAGCQFPQDDFMHFQHEMTLHTNDPMHPVSHSPEVHSPLPPKSTAIPANHESDHSQTETHFCQWVTNPDAPEGKQVICGKEFRDPEMFHDHLCRDHCGGLSSETGYRCLWYGCPRKGDQTFGARSKLCRHMITHTECKSPQKKDGTLWSVHVNSL